MIDETAACITEPDAPGTRADLLFASLKMLMLANMVWLWFSVKLGSLSMFVVGLIPVSWIVTGPVGLWALLFDLPKWVSNAFA